jgi:O-antigen/teichoic acid export membrane protein
MCDTLATRLTNGVIYPMLARVHAQRPAELGAAYYKIRLWFDLLLFTGLGGVAAMSGWIIALLYDERYAGAAEMMQILTFRAAVAALATLCEVCFVAQGASVYSFRFNLVVTIAMIVGMPVGGYFWGISGLLWATVLPEVS